MDPTACLRELLEAVADRDRDTALDRVEALYGWIGQGGFLPTVRRTNEPGEATPAYVVADRS